MIDSKLVVAGIAALSLTAYGAGRAYAQDEGGEEEGTGTEEGMGDGTEAPPPENTPPPVVEEGGDEMAPPMGLTVPKGKLDVSVGIAIGLTKEFDLGPLGKLGGPGKPITINPDIFYGVSDKLDVGIAHSGYALDGFWGDSTPMGGFGGGSGLCLSGEDGGCASVYNGPVGLLAHFGLVSGSVDLAADGGPIIRTLDSNGSADGGDMLLGFKVGVKGRKMIGTDGKMMIGFAPNISIGLNKRTVDDGAGGSITVNGEFLAIPVDFGYMVSPQLGVAIQTGIEGELDGFGDNYAVPLGLGAMYQVNNNISAGGAFVLHRITGGGEGDFGAADFRSLSLFVDWHN